MGTRQGHAPIIINYTLTDANTWYAINSAYPGARRWKLKTKESTPNAFDYDFTTSHSTFMSNSGVGISQDNCDLPIIYVRSATAGTVMELEIWQ